MLIKRVPVNKLIPVPALITFTKLQYVNSSPPSTAYMRQWPGSALVQIMAWRLFAAKPLSNRCWVIVNWTIVNKRQWSFNQNTKLFIMKMHLKISSAKWRPFLGRIFPNKTADILQSDVFKCILRYVSNESFDNRKIVVYIWFDLTDQCHMLSD